MLAVLLVTLGAFAVVGGVALLSWQAAVIVAGALMLLAGIDLRR